MARVQGEKARLERRVEYWEQVEEDLQRVRLILLHKQK